MKQNGFSLTEALVAIAILAMAASSILVLGAEQARTLATMEARAMARIAADNLMVQELTGQRLQSVEASLSGEIEIGNRQFIWQRTRKPTNIPEIVEISYVVQLQGQQQILAQVTRLRRE